MSEASSQDSTYTVVARRYRPKSFDELVGQENVSQALATAIRTGRIGHAYLFTGARGVGKTSTARIFAKALNSAGGPSIEADKESDIARAIDAGEDMDVLEIDGASNRGIEEIRQLRANVNVRPSRSRFKIYIIDEVHMLTTAAFNALLKTLEEPPEHVKFIFCTTDPEKIPITVLSRCQRFDFPPVKKEAIQERLRLICQNEGFEADEDALSLIARRAAGSMRDSQSLLEQILSFSDGRITVESVHEMLGTADETSLYDLVERFIAHDAVGALQLVEKSISQGSDAGQFAEQLLGYLRDLMTRAVGGSVDLLRHVHAISPEQLLEQSNRWGLQSLISAMQILDDSLVRMRHSMHSRTLLEVTLVQITQLHRLESLLGIASSLPSSSGARPTVVGESINPARPMIATTSQVAASSNSVAGVEQKKKLELADSVKGEESFGAHTIRPMISSVAESSKAEINSQSQPNVLLKSDSHADKIPSAHLHSASRSGAADSSVGAGSSLVSVAGASQRSSEVNGANSAGSQNVRGSNSATISGAELSLASDSLAANGTADAFAMWRQLVSRLQGLLADFAALATGAAWSADGSLAVIFDKRNQHAIEHLQRPDRKSLIDRELNQIAGRLVKIVFQAVQDSAAIAAERSGATDAPSAAQRVQRLRQVAEHPLVKPLIDQFGGEIVRLDPPSANRNNLDRKGP
jgi:DNA polymerase-3 subunit gamma/tau